VGSIEEEPTPLEERLDALGRRLVWMALGVAALVVHGRWRARAGRQTTLAHSGLLGCARGFSRGTAGFSVLPELTTAIVMRKRTARDLRRLLA
jgi:hypothetical protein